MSKPGQDPKQRLPATRLLACRRFLAHHWSVAATLIGVCGSAWVIYRPDVGRPFDFIDFPETLLVLQQHETLAGRVAGLTTEFLGQARFNLVVYILVAAKWSVFGWWTPGWQLARGLTMSLVVVLSYVLLRRLRMSGLGALAGATLFVTAPPAVRGWIRLTSAEPLVALFVLTAAILATEYPTARRKAAIAVAICSLGVLAVLSKEILVVAFALPVYLLMTIRPSGMLGPPRIDRTNRGVLSAVIVSLSLAMIGPLWAYLNAPAGSYGRGFGASTPTLFELLALTLAGLVPFVPAPRSAGMLLVNTGYWGLLAAGLPQAWRRTEDERHAGWLLPLAIGLPFLCALVYLPWPSFQIVYAVPFLFGEAILVAMATTLLQRGRTLARGGAVVAWCMVLAYSIPEAVTTARRFDTIQVVTGELVARLARARDVDSVLVVGPQTVYDQRALLGPRLSIYARASGRTIPPTKDVSCETGWRAAATASNVLVVWSSLQCAAPPVRGDVLRRGYPRIDWSALRLVEDSTRLDILPSMSGAIK